MGFWHTGYIEFHEYSGLGDFDFDYSPPRHVCSICEDSFATADELRRHRFEGHPIKKPTILVRGRDLGTHPLRITSLLRDSDICIGIADRAQLNGSEIPIQVLRRELTKRTNEVCRLVLSKDDVATEFTLDFRIASSEDLQGVERAFEQAVCRKQLDSRTVENFIQASKPFGSALGYCDGICSYLYGVLAKERVIDTSLPYELYVIKFSKAAEQLSAYDRPLARTIGSLIEFHFNHFEEAARLAGRARIGCVASRYRDWLAGSEEEPSKLTYYPSQSRHSLEELVTDWDTEQIARWAVRPLRELSSLKEDIESFSRGDVAEYDHAKLQMLLSEIGLATGNIHTALQNAKSLRNISAFERWAEAIIRKHTEVHHGHG